jgi:hypothetical protein
MRTKGRAGVMAVCGLAAVVLPFGACDPVLTPDQRILLTGTSDSGTLHLTVTPQTLAVDATETEANAVEFKVQAAANGTSSFQGTIALALSGLPPEVELVSLGPNNFPIQGDQSVDGTIRLRSVGTRVEAATAFLTMTSTGAAGSVVVHPPVPVVITAVRSRLEVSCQRQPEAGLAPLTVEFSAKGANCEGPCRFRWEFGDGGTAETRNVTWTYERGGRYHARVTLTDDRSGRAICHREVTVHERSETPQPQPTPTPGPTPSPTTNRPPVVTDTTVIAVPGQPLQRRIVAAVIDPDPTDTVRWTAEVFAGTPSPTTVTPSAGNGASVSTLFTAQAAGGYAVRLTGVDNHGAIGTFTLTLTVP